MTEKLQNEDRVRNMKMHPRIYQQTPMLQGGYYARLRYLPVAYVRGYF